MYTTSTLVEVLILILEFTDNADIRTDSTSQKNLIKISTAQEYFESLENKRRNT